MTEQELSNQLKEKRFLPVYLFYGIETKLIKTRAQQLINRVIGKEKTAFNYCRLEGEAATVDAICASAVTLPVFSKIRLTEVVDPPIESFSKEEISRLNELFLNISENNLTLIVLTDSSFAGKPSSKFKVLLGGIETAGGGVVQWKERTPAFLVKTLISRAEKLGSSLSSKTAYYLIDRCGKDLTSLTHEIDKLSAYATGREITSQDIKLLTVPTLDAGVFDLSREILKGNAKGAFSALNELFAKQTEPLMILGALSSSFLDLYRAKCAQLAGEGADAITGYYPYKGREFSIRNAMRDASRFSYAQLSNCIKILSDADRDFKTAAFSPQTLLEITVAKMLKAGDLL